MRRREEWQRDFFSRIHSKPSPILEDFGFHNDEFTVQLCEVCARLWNYPPEVTIRQPLELLLDMLRLHNLREADEFLEMYEDQEFYPDEPQMSVL